MKWDELESMTNDAQKGLEESAEKLGQSVRGGAGSPVEQRISQAFQDQAKVNSAIEAELSAIARQNADMCALIARQNDLIDRQNAALEATESALRDAEEELGTRAYRATERTLESQRSALERMERQAEATIGALGRLDESAAENYGKAVDDSCKRLTRTTAVAGSAILVLSCVGAFFALVGLWWTVQFVPFWQQLVTDYPWVPIAALGVIVGLLFGVAEWQSRRHY